MAGTFSLARQQHRHRRVLGVHVFDDPNELRQAWHSRFGALHYTLRCPFPPGLRPTSSKVTVYAEFTDYLTGQTLTAVKEVDVSTSNRAALSDQPNND